MFGGCESNPVRVRRSVPWDYDRFVGSSFWVFVCGQEESTLFTLAVAAEDDVCNDNERRPPANCETDYGRGFEVGDGGAGRVVV
jgi:hypothetical protein